MASPEFTVQPPGPDLDGGPVDAQTAGMQAALFRMGVRVGYAGNGWYEATDVKTGLTRYRWQTVLELRRQMYAERGVGVEE